MPDPDTPPAQATQSTTTATSHDKAGSGSQGTAARGSHLQTLTAGSLAGLLSRFAIAPLDVLKIRLQLGSNKNTTAQVVRDVWKEDGIRAFWKGNVPAEAMYVLYGGVQFSAYRMASHALDRFTESTEQQLLPREAQAFVAGAVAGAAATTATYPLDLLRTRFAAQGSGPQKVYRSLRSGCRDIFRHEGLGGFFQGLSAGVGQVVPYMGLFFAVYEMLRPRLAHLDMPFGSSHAVAGITAGVIAKTGVFPLDLIRKMLQVQGPTRTRYVGGRIPLYGEGVFKTGQAIVKMDGWRGLYRGLAIGLLKSAPASAVTMWTYETALKGMQKWDILSEDG